MLWPPPLSDDGGAAECSDCLPKVCLCYFALWLGCQLTPRDLSQEADCRGIPITLARADPLSSPWHLSPLSASFLHGRISLPPSEVDNKDILRVLLDVRPTLDLFSLCFLYLIVALLSYSASTIFTHQKTKKQGVFSCRSPCQHVNHPSNPALVRVGGSSKTRTLP